MAQPAALAPRAPALAPPARCPRATRVLCKASPTQDSARSTPAQRRQKQQQQQQQQAAPTGPGQRAALAAAAAALTAALLGGAPAPALAADAAGAAGALQAPTEAIQPVYFGNGCFWGRQFDFVGTEQRALGRAAGEVSAVVGYAGGQSAPADGKVCYYGSPRGTVYEELGHAEVVQVDLRGEGEAAKEQYREFARTYFQQFRKTPFGMLRLDPQDAGPGYRNVVGLPGGVDSPLFAILQEANENGMRLLPGEGNTFDPVTGMPTEGDEFNTVWVVDSNKLGFYRAELWHQMHNGIGKAFPEAYRVGLKRAVAQAGRIAPTGCPERGDVFF